MLGIIVSGHGHFATGIVSSLELIMGKQTDLVAIDFPFGSSVVELNKMFDEAFASLQDCEDIVILTDLFSGSPFNVAMNRASSNSHLHLYYGTNLGMLMGFASKRMFNSSFEDIAENVLDEARQNIGVFDPAQLSNISSDSNEEDEF